MIDYVEVALPVTRSRLRSLLPGEVPAREPLSTPHITLIGSQRQLEGVADQALRDVHSFTSRRFQANTEVLIKELCAAFNLTPPSYLKDADVWERGY